MTSFRQVYDLSQVESQREKQMERLVRNRQFTQHTRFTPLTDYIDDFQKAEGYGSPDVFSGRSTFMGYDTSHPMRAWCIRLIRQYWFKPLILFLIVLNSIFVAMDNPLEKDNDKLQQFLWISDLIFTVLFTIEMMIKITAMGFLVNGKRSYLRDPWNMLDFVVVALGYFNIAPSTSNNFGVLRIVRILRPLRTINGVKKMKIMTSALISSIPLMIDVFMLFTLVFLLFGIAGVQLFKGSLQNRCFDQVSGLLDTSRTMLCSRTGPFQCPSYQICKASGMNPNGDATSFDDIFQSWLVVLQIISLEGWSDIMYLTFEAVGYWSVLYFITLVLMGSFFLVNLVNAVMCSVYKTEHETIEEEEHNMKMLEKKGSLLTKSQRKIKLSSRSKSISNITSKISKYFSALAERIVAFFEPVSTYLHEPCRDILESKYFDRIIIVLIFGNTVILASEHFQQPDYWTRALEIVNYLFTGIFFIEAIIKMNGLGYKVYFNDNLNIFDLVVVLLSFVEIAISASLQGFNGAGLQALRSVRFIRVMRVLKVARKWERLQVIIAAVSQSVYGVAFFTLVLLLFMYMYALLGMQLYAGRFKELDGSLARPNFDTFWWSIVTVFQVITEENWNEVMYLGIQNVGWSSTIYFVTLFSLGNYILLSLFLAILLDQFQFDEIDGADLNHARIKQDLRKLQNLGASTKRLPLVAPKAKSNKISLRSKLSSPSNSKRSTQSPASDQLSPMSFTFKDKKSPSSLFIGASSAKLQETQIEQSLEFKSLFYFDMHHPIRQFCIELVKHPRFELIMFILIIASTCSLAVELDVSSENAAIFALNIFFVVAFSLEVIVKSIAMGFAFHEHAYIRDSWNQLDFFVVVVGFLGLFFQTLGFFKIFRVFRAVRPLRLVRRLEGLRVAVKALLKSIPGVLNLMLVQILFCLIFGIIGIQLWKGLFYFCDGDASLDRNACAANSFYWRNPVFGGFENIFKSILILFGISSMELWPSVMYSAVDVSSINAAPVENKHPYYAIFFIIFVIISNFFILNLLIAVMIDSFNQEKASLTGTLYLTPKQRLYLEVQKLFAMSSGEILPIRPRVSSARQRCFDIVTHPWFEPTIIICICINVFLMCFEQFEQSDTVTGLLFVANILFTSIFLIETIFKVVGLGSNQYLSSKWNRFDFLIVVTSTIGLMITLSHRNSREFNPAILRVSRLLRVLRLVDRLKGLKRIMQALLFSVTSMFNIGSLLILLFYIYAIIGVSLFKGYDYGEHVTVHANFDSLGIAMLTLLRMATGESWNGIMHELMGSASCGDGGPLVGTLCGHHLAVIYFCSFTIIGSFMVLNLFVAIILENFERADTDQPSQPVLLETLSSFSKAWATYSLQCPWWNFWSDAELWMDANRFDIFIHNVVMPMGLKGSTMARVDKLAFYRKLNINLYLSEDVFGERQKEKYVINKYECLVTLVRLVIEEEEPPKLNMADASTDVMRVRKRRMGVAQKFGTLTRIQYGEHSKDVSFTISHVMTTIIAQAWLKGKRERRRLKSEVDQWYSSRLRSMEAPPTARVRELRGAGSRGQF